VIVSVPQKNPRSLYENHIDKSGHSGYGFDGQKLIGKGRGQMNSWEKGLDDIKSRLEMDEAHRLVLSKLPMILTPRMFFVNIQKKVEERSGADTCHLVYYQAAFESAYRYMGNSKEVYQIAGRDLLQQYLDSLSIRGWGRFEILQLAEWKGEARVQLQNSAIAEEFGSVGRNVCHAWAGSMAGAVQFLVNTHDKGIEVGGTETLCRSKEDSHCEFVVEPRFKTWRG
jgi:predicted hydrocarbon binding protein